MGRGHGVFRRCLAVTPGKDYNERRLLEPCWRRTVIGETNRIIKPPHRRDQPARTAQRSAVAVAGQGTGVAMERVNEQMDDFSETVLTPRDIGSTTSSQRRHIHVCGALAL